MHTLVKNLSQSDKAYKVIGILGFLFLCLFFTYNFYHGERISVNGGWGYDGINYATNARTDPVLIIKEKHLSAYHATRMLPSIIIHYGAKLFNFPLGDAVDVRAVTDQFIKAGEPVDWEWESVEERLKALEERIIAHGPENVISAFYIYNFLMLLLGAWIWILIAKEYKWSPVVQISSFMALFMNYHVLKYSIYYPILTDISGMIMGLLTFYLYLKNRLFLLVVVSFFSSFMWPSLLYTSLPLILFKIQKLQVLSSNSIKFSNWATGIFSVSMVVLTLYLSYSPENYLNLWWFSALNTKMLILSAPLMALYIFLGLRNFLDLPYIFSQLKCNINFFRIILACSLLFAVKEVVLLIANQNPTPFGPLDYVFFACRLGMLFPLSNIVLHTMDFGPSFLLIIFFWKDFVQVVKEKGLGLMIFVCVYVLLATGSESRQYVSGWPVFSILICEVLNRRGVSWPFVCWFLFLSLILSRFWLIYDEADWKGGIYHILYQHITISYITFLGTVIIMTLYILPLLKSKSNISIVKLTAGQFMSNFRNLWKRNKNSQAPELS